jgi:hypothetical protein
MRNTSIHALLLFATASLMLPSSAPAQWVNYRDPSTPRTRDGKPNLSAKPPRTRDGKPDLSGIWQPEGAPKAVLSRFFKDGVNGLGEDDPNIYFINMLNDYPFENPPMTPSAAAIFHARAAGMGRDHPAVRCAPWGMPAVDTEPSPSKIVQTPGVTYILYEENMSHRQIYTDGRKHTPDPQPTWLGYSVGKWDGDVFVVDTVGFNDLSWLDAFGHPHSEDMKITERFHRIDFGHTELQITVDDPKSYTKPISVKFGLRLLPDTDLIESFCTENEKDVQHLFAK